MAENGDTGEFGKHPEEKQRMSYPEALTKLETFTKREKNDISTVEQLQTAITGVADALLVVIAENGKLRVDKHPTGESISTYEMHTSIREGIPGDLRAYSDPKNKEYVFVSKNMLYGMQKPVYDVTIPLSSTPDSEEFEATEWSPIEGKPDETVRDELAPMDDPDPEVQQSYARVLETALKDILAVAKQPTIIPDELTQQFTEEEQ